MLTWGAEGLRRSSEGERSSISLTAFWSVLLSAAAVVFGCIMMAQPAVRRGGAAVRALEQATGVSFGGRTPASPDIAIVDIGPPMARRVSGDTLTMVFAVPGRRDPTELLYVAIQWVDEVPVEISTR